MLKDKYRFKFSHAEAIELMLTLEKMFIDNSQAKHLELKLPIAVLLDFQKRLNILCMYPQSSKIKFHLKRTEALAFMILYLGNSIATTTETSHIAHEINTTI